MVALGYDTLVNVGYNAKSWYLDNLNVQWDAVYSNEPCDGVPDDLCNAHVIGGHGEMWGETVDASDLEQTVWPRLAAIGAYENKKNRLLYINTEYTLLASIYSQMIVTTSELSSMMKLLLHYYRACASSICRA